jgi:hypothetical protein
MTEGSQVPEKSDLRARLFEIAVQALRKEGWKVEKVAGSGSSVRRIHRGLESRVVSIRTTRDTWIAFPRNETDTGWGTLSEMDAVVAVSVDDPKAPKNALVHMIDGDEMRDRFDRAYKARRAAGHKIRLGRGAWVSLYLPEGTDPPSHVGAGAGLQHPPFARVALTSAAEPRDR